MNGWIVKIGKIQRARHRLHRKRSGKIALERQEHFSQRPRFCIFDERSFTKDHRKMASRVTARGANTSTRKWYISVKLMRLPLTLNACSTGYLKPEPGNYEIPKPIYVSRFYEQHVAKNIFLLEGRNYGMALMQNQNYQKISNKLKEIDKFISRLN